MVLPIVPGPSQKKSPRQMTDQELFEVLRMLVILHGEVRDVNVLHELKERFNNALLYQRDRSG
jgi:hypothetical protein